MSEPFTTDPSLRENCPSVKELLCQIFDDLGIENQKKFKSKLSHWKKKSHVEMFTTDKVIDSADLADLMVKTFTLEDAVTVTLEILEAIGCHQLALEFRKRTRDSKVKYTMCAPERIYLSLQGSDKTVKQSHKPIIYSSFSNWDQDLTELTFQGPDSRVAARSSLRPAISLFGEDDWTERNPIMQQGPDSRVAAQSSFLWPPFSLFGEKDWTQRNPISQQVWHNMVCQYKKSVIWPENKRNFLSGEQVSLAARYEEVKCISGERNLIELLSLNCSLSSEQILKMISNHTQRVLIIIDGFDDLDELRFTHHEFYIASPFQRAPPEVIICSLLREQILFSSSLLITTRTEIPRGVFLMGQQRFFKIVGFCEKGVEEYFQKFFQDDELFRKAFTYVKANKSLFTACSIPVNCWIICTVMRERFSDGAEAASGLETTSIYVDFVCTLLEHHCQVLSQSVPTLLRSLGQLAERGMLEQQVLFDEKTVNETVSVPYPFLSKFLIKRMIDQETMFSFMHLSFQEFFTALYCVLLDEEESQRKVRELIHTVERGWALSCWSDKDFSKADVENCVNINNLRLNLTSDNLKILQSALHCEELWLKVDYITDEAMDLISALGEGKIVKELMSQDSSVDEFFPLNVLRSVPGLKKVHIQTDRWVDRWNPTILSLVQDFPSLNELRINAAVSFHPLKNIESLRVSLTQTGWTLNVWRKSVLIERDQRSLTVSQLKTIKTENIESKRAESPSGQSSSGDAEVFTPEHVQQDDEDKHKNTYRFVCPHAGQFRCSLTSLVFVTEGEGEVLYKTVSWDPRVLDGLEENKDGLAVAHLTGGNTEIMQPLQVTETHVMINIRDLSIFGVLKRFLFPPSPIGAQVLVFLRPITVKQRENILDVHLLPFNVPLSEVKEQHVENTHIKTSSKCSLTPGTEYSLCCQPEGSTVQPETEMFECNFGPNYHPTFEAFVNVNIDEVKLSILDKTEGKEVWVPRRILLTGKDADPPAHKTLTESVFVKKHRDKLIERVLSAKAIADGLSAKDMIPGEMYSDVNAAKTRQEKTRLLLDALNSGGASVKAEFYRLLKEKEPYLVDELETGHSGVE
ncbi:caspase recruitment domain-containing protein [Pimephales promelas]|nr:caspase recruitment domain-containing protein [Pimephales promelas]